MKSPDVSSTRSGDLAIAYQVVGDGPTDIVFVRGITGDAPKTTPKRYEALARSRANGLDSVSFDP